VICAATGPLTTLLPVIAAVVTYQRNALGNAVGTVVQPADVKALR
jgi:hypothetical protein